MTDVTPKRKRGRPRKPRPVRLSDGRIGARVTLDLDGETVRKRLKFDTTDAQVMSRKIARLAKEPALPIAILTASDTFAEAAVRVNDKRVTAGIVRADEEIKWLRRHVFDYRPDDAAEDEPTFGDRPVAAITSELVKAALEAARDRGLGRGSVKHIRKAMKATFDAAKVKPSPMAEAPMPAFRAVLKKEHAVLEDDELILYVQWQHPVERFRLAVLERQTMSAIARCMGGQRTNDLHEATWDAYDIGERGDFVRGWVPRTKTKQPQRMTVPPELRPVVRAWWVAQGKPTEGLMFPCLRGERAGEKRFRSTHAKAMRIDLQRCFGIFAWSPTGGRRGGKWTKVREMTAREKELFTEMRYTSPVDFHSHRRAFAQALDRAGANLQTSLALTAHGGDGRTHALYVANGSREREIPAGAVPALDITGKSNYGRSVANIRGGGRMTTSDLPSVSSTSKRAQKDSNLRPTAPEDGKKPANHGVLSDGVSFGDAPSDGEMPHTTAGGHNSRPIIERALTLSDDVLAELLAMATKAKRWDLAQGLTEQLGALAAALPPNVTSLDAARKRRGDGGA